MKKDKLKIYLFSLSLIVILFLALFVANSFTKYNLAITLVVFAVLSILSIKKKNRIPAYEKEVTYLMIGFTAIYMILLYIFLIIQD